MPLAAESAVADRAGKDGDALGRDVMASGSLSSAFCLGGG